MSSKLYVAVEHFDEEIEKAKSKGDNQVIIDITDAENIIKIIDEIDKIKGYYYLVDEIIDSLRDRAYDLEGLLELMDGDD